MEIFYKNLFSYIPGSSHWPIWHILTSCHYEGMQTPQKLVYQKGKAFKETKCSKKYLSLYAKIKCESMGCQIWSKRNFLPNLAVPSVLSYKGTFTCLYMWKLVHRGRWINFGKKPISWMYVVSYSPFWSITHTPFMIEI